MTTHMRLERFPNDYPEVSILLPGLYLRGISVSYISPGPTAGAPETRLSLADTCPAWGSHIDVGFP